MYERMLDKAVKPTDEEMAAFCADTEELYKELNSWLTENFGTAKTTEFPYGNKYGWGIGHRKGKKLICHVFPENGSFTVMLRMSDTKYLSVYNVLSDYTQKYIDNRYPCGDGGYIHYRILNSGNLNDIKILLNTKIN